jgi:hypothetical protein
MTEKGKFGLFTKALRLKVKMTKSQAPMTKQFPNLKHQNPNRIPSVSFLSLFGNCDLVLGTCLKFGAWCL